jgi:hypothetical protein
MECSTESDFFVRGAALVSTLNISALRRLPPKNLSHAIPQGTRRGLDSVAEQTFSSEGTEKPSQAFSFAFFAPSRETNLLSKSAPLGQCILRSLNQASGL